MHAQASDDAQGASFSLDGGQVLAGQNLPEEGFEPRVEWLFHFHPALEKPIHKTKKSVISQSAITELIDLPGIGKIIARDATNMLRITIGGYGCRRFDGKQCERNPDQSLMKRLASFLTRGRFLLSISLFWLVLSILSDGINTLLLPERLLNLSGSQSQATVLGLLSFIGLLAGMLIQPVAGAWSDALRPRWGRKGMLAVGTLLVLLALAVFAFSPGLISLAIGYLLVQVSLSVVQAAQQGFIPDLVPARERGLASGMKNFMDIGGAMLGFVLLGQLLGGGQHRQAVVIIGVLMLAALLLTVLLVRERREPAGSPVVIARSHSSPFHLNIRQHHQFFWLVVARFFFLLGTYTVGRFLLLFVASRLGLRAEDASEAAGNVLAGLALVTVLAAPLAGWATDRYGRKPLMLFGAMVSAAGTLGYIFAGSLSQIFVFGCLLSLGSAAFASANWAMTSDVVPKEEAARFFGIANFGTAGAAAAAGLFGPLVDTFNRAAPGSGYIALFTAATLAFIACAISLRSLQTQNAELGRERIPTAAGASEEPMRTDKPKNPKDHPRAEDQTSV